MKHMHQSTHLGARKLKDLIRHARIKIHQQNIKIEQVVSACKTYQLTNTRTGPSKKEADSKEPTLEHNGRSTSLKLNQETMAINIF